MFRNMEFIARFRLFAKSSVMKIDISIHPTPIFQEIMGE
jgi:hypothetical protein